MNRLLAAPLILLALQSEAALHKFHYSNGATIAVEAPTRTLAYATAATACFKLLTHETYPGEEAGLAIIDLCANPTNYK